MRTYEKSRSVVSKLTLFIALMALLLFPGSPATAQTAESETAYVSKTYGIPLRDGYLLYDDASDENAAAWSKFLTMNAIVSTDDPIKQRTWGALEGFFYWYYDEAARHAFIRSFASPKDVKAYLSVYGSQKDFFMFFNRLSEFKKADLIEQLFAQIKSHPDLRPVTGPLRVAYAKLVQTSGYDFTKGRLKLDGITFGVSIRNQDRTRKGFPFGFGLRRLENAATNYETRHNGIPMSRDAAEALIARLHRAAGLEPDPLRSSHAMFYAGMYITISPDRTSGTMDKLIPYADFQLTQPLSEIDGADLWTDAGARRQAAERAEAARVAALAAEEKRREEARLEAERQEAARLKAERDAIQARVAAERDTKALAVLGITIGMTEAEARAILIAANEDFAANMSRTGFERLMAGSNVKDRVELDACDGSYDSIAQPFADFRYTLAGDNRADTWFLPTLGPESDAKLLAKSIELAETLPASCHLKYAVPGASFETFARYQNETIGDAIRVYIGQSGPQAGRVTAIVRVLRHVDLGLDVFDTAEETYGTPNFHGRETKYWLANPDAPVLAPDMKAIEYFERSARPAELVSCIGAGTPDQGNVNDLAAAVGSHNLTPYGAPPRVAGSLDLRFKIAQSCGTVLGLRKRDDDITFILLLDTDYVVRVRKERDAVVESKPKIKL